MMEYRKIYPGIVKMKAALFGEQVSLSWPVPDVVNGVRVEKYFLYAATPAPVRSRPFGLMTVAMDNGRLLAYQDCRIEDFVDTEKYGFDRKLDYALPREMSIDEFKVSRSLLEKLYGQVRQMAFTDEMSEKNCEILLKYSMLMDRLVPKDLIPYYVAMGRNFNEWRNRYV